MRIGIRNKLIMAFFATLFLPLFAVAVTGSNAQGTPAILEVTRIVLALLVPFCICAFILVWMISESILKPLKELDSATKKIIEGDFDFELSYKKDDEMGDMYAAFELMRERLKASLEKQAALEQSRKELIASISHDLRTPMSSIKGYVEGLQDGIVHDRDKFARYIAVIKSKTESLDNLIERLFQYSQLELDDQKGTFRIYNSKELLETIMGPIEIEFIDCPIKLEVIKPFPSVHISADKERIAQVFDNLISNAKRYVHENATITIEANVNDDRLKVTIKDNGTGISQEDLPHVFDNFYRAEKSRSRNFGGAGLGLAICKRIIENHQGNMWAESTLDIGTTFCFTIPIADSELQSTCISNKDGRYFSVKSA